VLIRDVRAEVWLDHAKMPVIHRSGPIGDASQQRRIFNLAVEVDSAYAASIQLVDLDVAESAIAAAIKLVP
jgi:hypothetical protein